jgi:hypothetical protein
MKILSVDDPAVIQRVYRITPSIFLGGNLSAMPESNAAPEVYRWCRDTGCALTMMRVFRVYPSKGPERSFERMHLGFLDENSAISFKMRWF